MAPLQTKQLAERLYAAYKNNRALEKDQIPPTLDLSAAYSIQHALTLRKTQDGEPLRGYKISLTSPETQKLFNSEKPLYGALTAPALSDGTIELASMLSPLIEIELIFLIQEDIQTADSLATILSKTKIAPGIEVPDCRFTDWFPNITLGQVVADSAVAGRIIIGEAVGNVSFDQLDDIRGELFLDGQAIASGRSSEVLRHPVNAIKWLAEELESHGLSLEKGMAVSSGTFILPKKLETGRYEAHYEGIGSVALTVH
ncbi:hypothetical protein [Planococcus sp. ISL-109]|uniref:2-keto-4-pentenoate hydratase n=1 Tax=Planococcus sp. ISL-109 TaxID=2819166 RepID=UPI001BEA90A7|nr:hypothetical protein [Planococcus sp. ISL-109]MBT2581398.1 hypothetical protein [Planococcus sp. ISL-109]